MQRTILYYIARTILLACSTLWLVSGLLFWVTLDGRPLGIVAASPYGVPLWHLVVPLIGLLSLILLIKEPPGVYWVAMCAAAPGFFATVIAFRSLNEIPELEITLGAALNVFAFLTYGLAGAILAHRESAYLASSLAPLANVGRIGHLKGLFRLAQLYGWQIHGPYPPENVLVVDGIFHQRAIHIRTGQWGNGDYICNFYVKSRRKLWPACAVRRMQVPTREDIDSSQYRRLRVGPSLLHVYLWPPEGHENVDEVLDALTEHLDAGRSLLLGRIRIRSYPDGVMFHRMSLLRMRLMADDVKATLEWLADLARLMEESGMADPESELNSMAWEEE
jgi:hypothetical protein